MLCNLCLGFPKISMTPTKSTVRFLGLRSGIRHVIVPLCAEHKEGVGLPNYDNHGNHAVYIFFIIPFFSDFGYE